MFKRTYEKGKWQTGIRRVSASFRFELAFVCREHSRQALDYHEGNVCVRSHAAFDSLHVVFSKALREIYVSILNLLVRGEKLA